MESKIRKISIGSDYKNDAMHYSVGQEVYGGHVICDILKNDDNSYNIYIKKNDEVNKTREKHDIRKKERTKERQNKERQT